MEEKDLLRHLKKAKEGSLEDFELIYRYSLPSLKAISSKYFIKGGEKEDLIQEGALGIMRAILDYDEEKGASFKTFMELVVERKIQNAVKKSLRNKHSLLNDAVSIFEKANGEENMVLDLIEDKGKDPGELIDEKESLWEFTGLIQNSLSKLEAEILLEYIEGKTYKEIGKDLNKDEKVIDNALQRIRKKLSKLL